MESYRNFGCGGNCRGNGYRYNQSRNMNPYSNMGYRDCDCKESFETDLDCSCKSSGNVISTNDTFSHMHKDRPCGEDCPFLGHMPVGMGYVPMQEWCEMYDKKTALCQGTAFPDLNLIFCGVRGKRS